MRTLFLPIRVRVRVRVRVTVRVRGFEANEDALPSN